MVYSNEEHAMYSLELVRLIPKIFLYKGHIMPLYEAGDAPTKRSIQYFNIIKNDMDTGIAGFLFEDRIIATSSVIYFESDCGGPFEIRLGILAVCPEFRGLMIGKLMLYAAMSAAMRHGNYSIMSMPDGEPDFVRHLLKFRCKPTIGVNTQNKSILYYQAPGQIKASKAALIDYRKKPPIDTSSAEATARFEEFVSDFRARKCP